MRYSIILAALKPPTACSEDPPAEEARIEKEVTKRVEAAKLAA